MKRILKELKIIVISSYQFILQGSWNFGCFVGGDLLDDVTDDVPDGRQVDVEVRQVAEVVDEFRDFRNLIFRSEEMKNFDGCRHFWNKIYWLKLKIWNFCLS